MSRLSSLEPLHAACAAGSAAVATWLSVAADVALQLFGVPLPVVLAALTGALGARVFVPPVPFWRAVVMSVFWTCAGAFGAQLAMWLAAMWVSGTPPAGALGGLALVTSALGQRVAPILWENGGAALERKLNGMFKGGDRG